MKCGYCGVDFNDAIRHRCDEGIDFVVRENSQLRIENAALRTKKIQLESEVRDMGMQLAAMRRQLALTTRNGQETPEHIKSLIDDYPVILERLLGKIKEAADLRQKLLQHELLVADYKSENADLSRKLAEAKDKIESLEMQVFHHEQEELSR